MDKISEFKTNGGYCESFNPDIKIMGSKPAFSFYYDANWFNEQP